MGTSFSVKTSLSVRTSVSDFIIVRNDDAMVTNVIILSEGVTISENDTFKDDIAH
jgi:hypothetical protein